VGALRGSAGVAFALGRSGLVPFDARFFAGGGTSVRGWGLRELGPGGAFAQRGEVVNVSGADVRLEAAAEVRYAFMSTFLGADWIAVAFADAGNVWYGPRNPGLVQNAPRPRTGRFRVPDFVAQTALGTGTGLRLAWPFIVVRLDAAVRARDPAKRGLFYDGLMPTLHFGLGHAF
jgi:outer membrane protein insertion porin family